MDLNKHIVDQRIRKIVSENHEWFSYERNEEKRLTKAFVLLGVASYLGIELSEALSLMTEGGGDAGVDAIFIGDIVDYDFPVTIFQGKYKFNLENDSNFPANSVLRVVNAVKNIFDRSKSIQMNDDLLPKVEEIRSLIADGYVPRINCVLISNGIMWNQEGQDHIDNEKFPSDQVSFDLFNHNDIIKQLQKRDGIKETLSLQGKGILEEFNYKRVIIGKMSVAEIAELMNKYGDSLLEKNIRKYLGLRKNRVNEGIQTTLATEKRNNFYFFNNGITMTCSKFMHNALEREDWKVKVEDLQIINGGQTCKTILQTVKAHGEIDFSQVFVLLRLYELPGEGHEELLADITYATNSQNPVDLRDLKANDKLQKDLEIAVGELGYSYKTKRDNIMSFGDSIPSSVAAEAVYAIWRGKPHLAKMKRNELFGKFYNEVFDGLNAAQLVMAVLIFRFCDSQRKKKSLLEQYPHISYSNYFLSMLMGREMLSRLNIQLKELNHRTFEDAKTLFDQQKDELFSFANNRLIESLNSLYTTGYQHLELRRLSAVFRRGDLLEYFQ